MDTATVGLTPPKTIVITGASRGIGLCIAKKFAANGANLVLTDIEIQLETLRIESEILQNIYDVEILRQELDVLDIAQIKNVICNAVEAFGTIDVLVNNAGTNIFNPAITLTEEQWDMVLDINLKGAFFMMQEAAKVMIKQRIGSIINISSQHGLVGNELRAPYCASKAGLINLSRALATEWAKYNIRVNSVAPTFVLTENNESLLNDTGFIRHNLTKIPLKRYAIPEDVANAVYFLSSNESSMITGHCLSVDGGWTAI
ncbi:short-chain dehydrogenase [Clostridia bacterium]|nr:short-chain dehydrogenase [Clostridia bacterium]